jgi:hypothetical protein
MKTAFFLMIDPLPECVQLDLFASIGFAPSNRPFSSCKIVASDAQGRLVLATADLVTGMMDASTETLLGKCRNIVAWSPFLALAPIATPSGELREYRITAERRRWRSALGALLACGFQPAHTDATALTIDEHDGIHFLGLAPSDTPFHALPGIISAREVVHAAGSSLKDSISRTIVERDGITFEFEISG